MEGKELIQAWISSDLKKKILAQVKKEDDLTVSSWVRRAIKAYLEAQSSTTSP